MTTTLTPDQLGNSLSASFVTEAEVDNDDHRPANVADGLFAVARALGKIADALNMDRTEHAICMGVRHGLFGAAADAGSTILELKMED